MYPATIFEWDDQSAISTLPIQDVTDKPLLCSVFSSDKGPEAWTRISGEDFFNMYGKNISFENHGQPLLQTAISINAGAELLCKRVVADDATLANTGVVATVTEVQVQNPANPDEPTDTIPSAQIKYTLITAEGCLTEAEAIADLQAQAAALGANTYLLWVISDIGRGLSNKRFVITPNYVLSKSLNYTIYQMNILEDGTSSESMHFRPEIDKVISNQNISLASMMRTNSNQLYCTQFEDQITAFMANLQDVSGLTPDEMFANDILFGNDKKGNPLGVISVDPTGAALNNSFGNTIESGTNGAFGDAPYGTDAWTAKVVQAYRGEYDNTIFNLDQYKIDAVIDANYPAEVKRAIEALVSFREDCMYFRDMGLNLTSLDLIKTYSPYETTKNKFCADYCQSYDVIDPYTRKQITVTIGYSLARLFVDHFNNNVSLPFAGLRHNMIIPEAIYGTLSFAPVICPAELGGNQKDEMEELKINYASYIDEELVVETLYTSQELNSQFSFISNVLATQEVIKAIRTRCPVIRYSFIDGDDLDVYEKDVNTVIERYKGNFKSISMEYVNDPSYIANKIFYAVIKVLFRDFVQTEYFKITALNAEVTVS